MSAEVALDTYSAAYIAHQEPGITLWHGDCLHVMAHLIGQGVQADLVLADPPYGKAYKSNMGGKERRENALSKSKVMTDSIVNDHDLGIVARALPLIDQLLAPNRHAYLFADPDRASEVRDMVADLTSWRHKQFLIWDKGECGTMGDLREGYSQNYESVVYSIKGKRPFIGGKRPRAINRYEWQASWEPVHPNRKPPKLFYQYIEAATEPGELVLDPFMGSGPIARACKDLGRRYIGIELLPEHAESAARGLTQAASMFAGMVF